MCYFIEEIYGSKMKIIEFAGLPGCGKSTLCGEFIKTFTKTRIYTYKDVVRFVSTKRRRIIYGIFVSLNPFRWKYLKLLRRLVKNYDNVSIQAVYILMALYDFTSLVRLFNRKNLFILDEGFIQNITSVAHLQPMSEDKALTNLISYIKSKKDIVVINCHASENVVISRIRNRGRADRFNSIKNDEELIRAFKIKQDNISVVAKYFNKRIDICLDGNVEELLSQLIDQCTNHS